MCREPKKALFWQMLRKTINFLKTPYIKKVGLKSVICSPILYQNKVMGFIYLENNATENAFTKEKIEVLNILSSQAAISLRMLDCTYLQENSYRLNSSNFLRKEA